MRRDLKALGDGEYDLLVIGGGIHGAATAWDATQRGFKVALVEARDFASGASSNSLKTIHGGLRYLQKADLRRMRESIGDRSALLRIAPELVRPLSFLMPLQGFGLKGREALTAGLWLNDLIAFDRNRGLPPGQEIPAGRVLARREVLERFPGIESRGLRGGALWHDAQALDSERLVLAFVQQAANRGAAVANYVEATGLLRSGGRVRGARAIDVEGGVELEIRARMVLTACGGWTGPLLSRSGVSALAIPLLDAWNVVLKRQVVRGSGLAGRARDRYIFLVPWRERSMLGTAYRPHAVPFADAEIESLVGEAQAAFPWAEITMDDVDLVHRGQGPGSRDAAGLWTKDLVIDHERSGAAPGMITTLGVKYTTARAVAERAVDLVAARLGRVGPRCLTASTPLEHARPLAGSLSEQVARAVRHEMALRLGDIVLRRTSLGSAGPPPRATIEAVARLAREELRWDDARCATEVAALERKYTHEGCEPGLLPWPAEDAAAARSL